MNPVRSIALALILSASIWPVVAATDYFWSCTKPDGTKYADASKCDKGDTAVKMMKGDQLTAQPLGVMQHGFSPDVCPVNPAYCSQPEFGAKETSPRAQAITLFMRKKQCELLRRFPERCTRLN